MKPVATYSEDMESGIEEKKRELRKRFRFERSQRSLGGDWLHLLTAREILSASVIASYSSYGDEPDTAHLNQSILRSGKTLLLPRVDEVGSITWVEWREGSRMEKDRKRRGLSQPIGEEFHGTIDVVICPALRVDRHGVRLGQGGGSYDRAFSSSSPASGAWKVALLHDEEISSEALPYQSHDIKVDAVALPEIVVRFKR